MLGSVGMAPLSQDTAARMRQKLAATPLKPVVPPPPADPSAWADMREALASHLAKAIITAPRGSASGCSGDRFEFWKSAYHASSEAEWSATVDLVCDYALGVVPLDVLPRW